MDLKGIAVKPAVLSENSAAPLANRPSADKAPKREATPSVERAETLRSDAEVREFLARTGRSLDIQFDEDTGYFITKVKAQGSGEIIRQIPTEEMLRIAKNIDQMRGRFVDLLA